jgi:hypothetical protein
MNKDFRKSLSSGQLGEKIVASYLCKNFNSHFISYNNSEVLEKLKKWDILLRKGDKKFYFEVKTDLWEYYNRFTGNIFIEVSCNGNPSGIMNTKSDYFCYYYPSFGELYIVKVEKLINEMRTNGGLFTRRSKSGDGGRVVGYTFNRYCEESPDVFNKHIINKDLIKHFIKLEYK